MWLRQLGTSRRTVVSALNLCEVDSAVPRRQARGAGRSEMPGVGRTWSGSCAMPGRSPGRLGIATAPPPKPRHLTASDDDPRGQATSVLNPPRCASRVVHAWSTCHRSRAVHSGRQRCIVAQVADAILRKQARVQNPDKDEVPGSSPPRPTTSNKQQERSSQVRLPPWRHGQVTAPSDLSRSCLPASFARPLLGNSSLGDRKRHGAERGGRCGLSRRTHPDRPRRAQPAGEYGGTASRLRLGRTRPFGGLVGAWQPGQGR
jgi:hypothetical protein